MEFQFNVNEYFKDPIVEIKNTLLPPDFAGDRRALWNTVNKVAEVVNEMGEASAHAQGLSKPITTAERLRQSDQSLYILVDKEDNHGNGAVTGMLKVGRKGLYVFDREGQHYQVTPPCVLDFYVHEKKQRSGLGKKLFEHMLEKEKVQPHNLAIDRPSEKFLNFLRKHYSLEAPIKQMNNYVVFDGFFPSYRRDEQSEKSPVNRTNGLQSTYAHNAPSYGRYGAPRPPCSMGQIIHNTSSQKNTEPASISQLPTQQENSLESKQIHRIPNHVSCQQRQENSHQQFDSQQLRYLDQTNRTQDHLAQYRTPEMVFPQQSLQEQVRMFPEKEIHAANLPYQDNQNYSNTYYNQVRNYANIPSVQMMNSTMLPNVQPGVGTVPIQQSSISVPVSQQNASTLQQQLPSGHIWPTQQQPQQVYVMSQPNNVAPLNQQINQVMPQNQIQQQPVSLPQTQFGMNPNSVQFLQYPQLAHGISEYPPQSFQMPQHQIVSQPCNYQSPQSPNQLSLHHTIPQKQYPQQLMTQPQHSYQPHISSAQHMAITPQLQQVQLPQTALPQMTQLYEPQTPQTRIVDQQFQQQPPISAQQTTYLQESQQKSSPPATQERQPSQPTPKETLVPQKSPNQQIVTQPQETNTKREERDNKNLNSDSVRALLRVDSKYFKPDPVHLKQPNHSIINDRISPRQTPNKEDTVASLIVAEQEFFENGMLREKYRTPEHYQDSNNQHSTPQYQLPYKQFDSNISRTPIEKSQKVTRPITNIQQYDDRLQHLPQSQPHSMPVQQPTQQELQPLQQYPPHQIGIQSELVPQRQFTSPQYSPEGKTPLSQQFSAKSAPNEISSAVNQNTSRGEPQPQYRASSAFEAQNPDNIQYRNETAEGKREKPRDDFQFGKGDHSTLENIQPEGNTGVPHSPTRIRQNSYIPNDFNPHAEGPDRVSSSTKLQESSGNSKNYKKKISRLYGLNEIDIRRKGYKSAIIKRTPDALEHDSLEFGYPPQVTKKRPHPRTILTMRGH